MRRLACLALLVALAPPARADDKPVEDWAQPIADLYAVGKLFDRAQYKAVRAAFAKAFERRHDKLLCTAYGDDYEALTAWLDKHADLKEEFYTALDEQRDKLPAALRLFRDLWKKSPDDVAKYPNLAIAVAVVWDEPVRGVYDYRMHQERTHSVLPGAVMKFGPADAFDFYATHAKEIQGRDGYNRLQALPWEFLTYVVDHRTPADEREWAVKNYFAKRAMIGKIYHEVEYDKEMARTDSKVCKLNDKPYTLESIRKYGGVCAMQADFAARVAKSLAIPAAWVWGEGVRGELHSWVMWVEVHGVGKDQLQFTLESHGRYKSDLYYTGKLIDPQTGEDILDRDMERRLGAVAADRAGKRQAELAMRAFPLLREAKGFDRKQKFAYLNSVLSLSHYNEGVWAALVQEVKDGDLADDQLKSVLAAIDVLVKNYTKYPDFTWKVAPELLRAQPNAAVRNEVYEHLVHAYEAAKRPDLACAARLKWAEYPAQQKEWLTAAKGLAQTIRKFPDEGRYVPAMMAKLEEACGQFKAGPEFLGKFYLETLSHIPPLRGDEPSAYCVAMYEKAIAFFKEQKKDRVAADLEAQLKLVKAGKKRS